MSAPEPPKISSGLPLPPPFYHAFTQTNTSRIAALRKAHRHLATPASAVAYAQSRDKDLAALVPRVPNAAPQYEYLQPPPEPADGRWRFNGDHFSLDDRIPSLEEQNIRRLVPGGNDGSGEGGGGEGGGGGGGEAGGAGREVKHLDRAFQLKKLAKSQLLNFLELTGILSQTPQDVRRVVVVGRLDTFATSFLCIGIR
jgi:mediator of RNA polymerase II transcription subunit 7